MLGCRKPQSGGLFPTPGKCRAPRNWRQRKATECQLGRHFYRLDIVKSHMF